MFTDVAALAISLAAVRIARRPADQQRSFGYYRFEILAAAFNALLLFAVALYILYEAYRRLSSPPEIQSSTMLVIAVLGLIINLISMRVLTGGKDESLNVKGSYLEVWSDMLGSLGVIAGAVIIRFTGWAWVDSVVAVGIGLWVLPRTWVLLKASLNILLEGVPEEVDVGHVGDAIAAVPGVRSYHDLHVWAITSGKVSLTVHVVHASEVLASSILDAIRERLAHDFQITHVTIQCELVPCEQIDEDYHFGLQTEAHGSHVGHSH
ncbi:cobalt-zinc-cadmium efflux system protein [Noviherbaspirillum suwonense]|uniref:Cobalt-zinc-cadmium efflux system protein n=1 Tax=Noviherbaspirillum suwonense TaxID=1224511 RepID=A0ABY1QXP5_9BURK|nr:cobalt-zinc-cadmium efflux system protein [Noviherbaspirillum suwonense]